MGLDRKKNPTNISVLIGDELINKGSAANTFIYVINYISNIVGKDVLNNDFPQIFSKEEFINTKYNTKYSSGKDDSGMYYIHTHTGTSTKKIIIENISKKYGIDIEIDILNKNDKEIVSTITNFVNDFEYIEFEDIIENINDTCLATLEIQRCLTDNDFLCDKLNQADKNYISSYFEKRVGVVIDIRKDVAKEIFFGGIKSDKLLEIIKEHKEKNSQKLKSWCNPYKILHPLVNDSYKHVDEFIEYFIELILNKLGDVKYGVSDFNGSQHQGSDNYWIAFYNKTHKHQSDGLQLFIEFENGEMNYGIYRHIDRVHISQHIFDGDINKFYQFILDNKHTILNDTEKSKDVLLKTVKIILQDNNNIALTSKEIVDRLETRVDNNTINDILSSDDIFEKIDDSKFKLKSYMPTKLKELFENNGFVTIDILKQILDQCGVQVNI
jgi:hypothetical protein